MSTPHTKPVNSNVLIVVAAIVFVVIVGAVTMIAIAIEDGARATTMIGLVVAPLTTLLGFLGLFVRVESIGKTVETVSEQTTDLTNGVGDSKMRAAVADVLRPDLVDPDVEQLLHVDRQRRASATDASAELLRRHDERPDLD